MGINDPRLASVKKEVKSLKEQVSEVAGGESATWNTIEGKPAVIAAGATAAAARSAIGAGTSSLAIGTTASTAAAGNHNHDSTYATTADLAALVARVEALESAE